LAGGGFDARFDGAFGGFGPAACVEGALGKRFEVEFAGALAEVVLPAGPSIKAATMVAASTGPAPTVRPRALALLVPSSFLRMMEVSASAPQAGVAQSRVCHRRLRICQM